MTKAKTVGRIIPPEDLKKCAEEVLEIQKSIIPTLFQLLEEMHISIVANEARRAELGEDNDVPAQEHEECDTRTTVRPKCFAP